MFGSTRSHGVDREMVQKAAWGLFQEAHEDDKLLTNDEQEALRAEEADGESQAFHFDYPSLLGARINGRMSWMPWT